MEKDKPLDEILKEFKYYRDGILNIENHQRFLEKEIRQLYFLIEKKSDKKCNFFRRIKKSFNSFLVTWRNK